MPGMCTLVVPKISVRQNLRQAKLCVLWTLWAEGTVMGLEPLELV